MSNLKNLTIWDELAETDPEYIKPVSFGARSFTAIDPQYQIRTMTETFGPICAVRRWDSKTDIVQISNRDSALLHHVTV